MVTDESCTDISKVTRLKSFLDGQILLIDKPLNWTSFDVVNKIRSMLRYALKIKKIKVGHAGTLDPLATGLMIVCTGKATKEVERLMGFDKCYEAVIRLGATTPSFDGETEVDAVFPTAHITRPLVEEALQEYLGEQQQIPPHFSAIKIEGKKAYEMARRGLNVEMKPRQVHFRELKLLEFNNNEARLFIKCSKGTYIRAFARDLGQALDSGGYLTALRRTCIGDFSVDAAITLETFKMKIEQIETS